jgi:hypothetical protein
MSARIELFCSCAPTSLVRVRSEDGLAWPERVPCKACGSEHALHTECLTSEGGLVGCLACGHPELYRAKEFPRAVGIAIVVVAALLAPFTFYLSLVLAAVIDAVLYIVVSDMTACYRCQATHHGFLATPKHPRFDREIEERLKYGEKAVMGKPMREGGTAGAPEPEH